MKNRRIRICNVRKIKIGEIIYVEHLGLRRRGPRQEHELLEDLPIAKYSDVFLSPIKETSLGFAYTMGTVIEKTENFLKIVTMGSKDKMIYVKIDVHDSMIRPTAT